MDTKTTPDDEARQLAEIRERQACYPAPPAYGEPPFCVGDRAFLLALIDKRQGEVERLERLPASLLRRAQKAEKSLAKCRKATKALLEELPELWGDDVVEGELVLSVHESAVYAALAATQDEEAGT